MGGEGSTRWRDHQTRGLMDKAGRLDAQECRACIPRDLGGWSVEPHFPDGAYRSRDEMTDPPRILLRHRDAPGVVDVALEYIGQHFGASRVWLRCPECSRRVRYLYRADSPRLRVGCLDCAHIAYPSTREPFPVRSTRKINRLRARLGETAPSTCRTSLRGPLHHRTRARLRAQLAEAEAEHAERFMAALSEDGACLIDVLCTYGGALGMLPEWPDVARVFSRVGPPKNP